MDCYLEDNKDGRYLYNNRNMSSLQPIDFWDAYFDIVGKGEEVTICERRYKSLSKKLVLEIEDTDRISVVNSLHSFVSKFSESDLPSISYYFCLTSDGKRNYRIYFPYYKFQFESIEDTLDELEDSGFRRMKNVPLYLSDDYRVTEFFKGKEMLTIDDFMSPFCLSNHTDFIRSGIECEYDRQESLVLLLSLSYLYTMTPDQNARDKEEKEYTIECDKFFGDLLSSINPKVIRQYNFWHDLGSVLKNRYKGSDEGLQKWKDITNKVIQKKVEGTIKGDISDLDKLDARMVLLYSQTDLIPLSINTLAWMTKLFNNKQYNKFKMKLLRNITRRAKKPNNLVIAKLLRAYFWLELKSCKNVWYWYDGTRWTSTSATTKLVNLVTGPLTNYIEEYSRKLRNQAINVTDPTQKKDLQDEISIVTSIEDQLGKSINSDILKFLAGLLSDDSLVKYMNMNPNLTVSGSHVLECVKYQEKHGIKKYKGFIVKRLGKPEDYKDKGSTIDLSRPDEGTLHDYNKWMCEMFPNKELREFVKREGASFFESGNPKKRYYAFIGNGDNSKSELCKMYGQAFGDGEDTFTMPSALIQAGDYKVGSTTSELVSSWCCKITTTSELDGMIIDPKKIKRHTGNDLVYLRDLFKGSENRPFYPKIVLFGNDMPPHDNADKQTIARLVIIPCLSVWRHDAPESYEEQIRTSVFKADENFKSELGRMARAFIYESITKYYEQWIEKKDDPLPSLVVDAVNNYWGRSDIYIRFEADHIAQVLDEEGNINMEVSLPVSSVVSSFLAYYNDSFPNRKQPSRDCVVTNFKRRMGDPYKNAWWGIEFRRCNSTMEIEGEEKRPAHIAECARKRKVVYGNRNLMYA